MQVWELFDFPCWQRLAAVLREQVERLRASGGLKCSQQVADMLTGISPKTSALARTYPPLLAKNDPGVLIRAADCPCRRMVTMKHHHARGPEETVCDLPPLVPARRASRRPPTRLWQNGMPSRAAAEDASQLASPEPGLCHRLADRSARDAGPIPAGTLAATPAVEPTSLGVRERPAPGVSN